PATSPHGLPARTACSAYSPSTASSPTGTCSSAATSPARASASSRDTRNTRPDRDRRMSATLGAPFAGPRPVCAAVKRGRATPIKPATDLCPMDPIDPAEEYRAPAPQRRVSVPISFTGDIGGFLFDLLSDIDAIVWEADADTFTIEFVNDRVHDLLGYDPMDI